MAKGLGPKQRAYAEARAAGIEPKAAGVHAGYAQAGIAVTVCRLEARADIKAAIAKAKKAGVVIPPPKADPGAEPEGNTPDKWEMKDHYDSPLDLFRDVWNNPQAPKSLRYQAAKDAAPYLHARKEGGKKEEKDQAAKDVAAGTGKSKGSKFATPSAPSKLRVVGGKG